MKDLNMEDGQLGDVDNVEVPMKMKMPPSTTFGKILFIITPLLLSAIAGLVGALLCFLYITADYHLDMWQRFSMLKLIFQNDEYILDRYYILFATLWGIMIVGIPFSYAYQNTMNMWMEKGMWK
jgi:hypothetical protein